MIFLLAILLIIFFAITRPKALYHPANFVFVFYALYFILPFSIFLFYDAFEVNYILPWGMVNDWRKLSLLSVTTFLWLFLIFYTVFVLALRDSSISRLYDAANLVIERLRPNRMYLFSVILLVIMLWYVEQSGGIYSWVTNYSETYLTGRKGLGWINLFLLHSSNLIAFIFGLILWKLDEPRLKKKLLAVLLMILLCAAFLQGVKSRIPYFLFLICAPVLFDKKVSVRAGVVMFCGMLVLFSIGMYFRSGGFYSGFQMNVEYLMSYFNAIFLHELALGDAAEGSKFVLFMGAIKYLEIFGFDVSREHYDFSVWLTSIYYPEHWFGRMATVQWPVATQLYFSFPSVIFWVLPVAAYVVWFWLLLKLSRSSAYFSFLFLSETIRLLSVLRGSFFPWELPVIFLFYIINYFVFYSLFGRRNHLMRRG